MSQYFITHVEPLHLLKGQEVRFFLREQDAEKGIYRSHQIIKEVPHYFFTPNYPPDQAEKLLAEIRGKAGLEHLVIEQQRYNKNKSFLRAQGSKEDRKILPPPFLCQAKQSEYRDPLGLNSPTKLLRWFYPPFMLIESREKILLPDQITSRKYASLEQVVEDSAAVLDLEVEDWEIGKDHIFMAVYLFGNRKHLYHDLPFEDEEYDSESGKFQLLRYSSQEDLGNKITAVLKEDDPLWIYGHNIMNYDQLQLRDLTEEYFPAVNDHYPITKSAQGFGRVITKGRWTLDTYGYHFNYENINANNKLGTISGVKKQLSYAQQALLVKEARQGSREAFAQLVDYCIADGYSSLELGQRYKNIVALKARHFRTTPDIMCSTGKTTIADDDWKRRHFRIKKTFQDGWQRQRNEESFSLDDLKAYFLQKGSTPGFFTDVHILYLTPFVAGSRTLLEKKSPELLERLALTADSREKFDLLQTLNAELSYLVEETARIFNPNGKEWEQLSKTKQYHQAAQYLRVPEALSEKQQAALYCLFTYHGLRKVEPLALLHNILEAMEKTNRALSAHELINAGTYFHFVRGEVDIGKLEQSLYGSYLGSGTVLSLSPERCVARIGDETDINRFIYQGFSAEKGGKCNFEKRVLKELVGKIFGGEPCGRIRAYLDTEIREFTSGSLAKENWQEYLFPVKIRTYYRTLLGEVLEQAAANKKGKITPEMVKAYADIKDRINDRFSDETQKELQLILEQCKNDFSYSYIEEVVDHIYNPHPAHVQLVYGAGYGGQVPVPLVLDLDLLKYKEKVRKQFEDFYQVLTPQLKFDFGKCF